MHGTCAEVRAEARRCSRASRRPEADLRSVLARHDLANRVTVAPDGVQAMEYLCREGAISERELADPALKRLPVVILTSSREEQDLITSYDLGVFWALINERPPNGVQ